MNPISGLRFSPIFSRIAQWSRLTNARKGFGKRKKFPPPFLPVSGPAVSQHLKVLQKAQVVRDEWRGTSHYFSLDPQGFDALDRKLLTTIIEKFDGGPVGIESLSAAVGEERGTLEDVIEPYLIQQGYLMRTARGRMATRQAYLHFGLRPPEPVAPSGVQPGVPVAGDDP